jgi:hypothetical protein
MVEATYRLDSQGEIMTISVAQFECIAGTSVVFLARHRHVDGTYAIPANTNSIHVKIEGDGGIGVTVNNASLTPVGDYLFTELQTSDPRWPIDVNDDDDEHGYNFRYIAQPAAFPKQGHYRVEFKFTHNDGTVTKLAYEGPARSSSM